MAYCRWFVLQPNDDSKMFAIIFVKEVCYKRHHTMQESSKRENAMNENMHEMKLDLVK